PPEQLRPPLNEPAQQRGILVHPNEGAVGARTTLELGCQQEDELAVLAVHRVEVLGLRHRRRLLRLQTANRRSTQRTARQGLRGQVAAVREERRRRPRAVRHIPPRAPFRHSATVAVERGSNGRAVFVARYTLEHRVLPCATRFAAYPTSGTPS